MSVTNTPPAKGAKKGGRSQQLRPTPSEQALDVNAKSGRLTGNFLVDWPYVATTEGVFNIPIEVVSKYGSLRIEEALEVLQQQYPPDPVSGESAAGSDRGQKMSSAGRFSGIATHPPPTATTATSKAAQQEQQLLLQQQQLAWQQSILDSLVRTVPNPQHAKARFRLYTDNLDKPEAATQLLARDFHMDQSTIRLVLGRCLSTPVPTMINTLKLQRAGLGPEEVTLMANVLPSCPTIRDLNLDSNSKAHNAFPNLLKPPCALRRLSLRHCCLTDTMMEPISEALGTLVKSNTTLLMLDLANNQIGDAGAAHLARGLRTNRTLASLQLAANRIADDGAVSLAQVLKPFPLLHEEILLRRRIMMTQAEEAMRGELLKAESGIGGKSTTSNLGAPSSTKGSAGQHQSPSGTSTTRKGSVGRASKQQQQLQQPTGGSNEKKRTSSKASAHSAQGTIDNKQSSGTERSKHQHPKMGEYEPKSLLLEVKNPYLTNVEKRDDGLLWASGNHHLVHLGLAFNKVCLRGMEELMSVLKHQESLSLNETLFISPPSRSSEFHRGLLHVSLVGNPLPETSAPDLIVVHDTNKTIQQYVKTHPVTSNQLNG